MAGFFFAGGADVPVDVLVLALKPNLAQTLLVDEDLFPRAGPFAFLAAGETTRFMIFVWVGLCNK